MSSFASWLPRAASVALLSTGITATSLVAQSPAKRIEIGTPVAALTVRDTTGDHVIKTDAAPATVVMFVSSRCPVSNAYNERMNTLYKDYSAKGVQFVFASANATESLTELSQFRDQKKIAFPVYKDENNAIADQFGAHVTPEVFVFGKSGTLLYRGAIDNNQTESDVTAQPLRDALDATLAGKAVATTTTSPFGCSIKRKRA